MLPLDYRSAPSRRDSIAPSIPPIWEWRSDCPEAMLFQVTRESKPVDCAYVRGGGESVGCAAKTSA